MTQNKEVPILIPFLAKIYTFLTIFHYKKTLTRLNCVKTIHKNKIIIITHIKGLRQFILALQLDPYHYRSNQPQIGSRFTPSLLRYSGNHGCRSRKDTQDLPDSTSRWPILTRSPAISSPRFYRYIRDRSQLTSTKRGQGEGVTSCQKLTWGGELKKVDDNFYIKFRRDSIKLTFFFLSYSNFCLNICS